MRSFRTPTTEFDCSIALDSSTINGTTTVTTAVFSTRRDELEILDSFYEIGGEIGFKPFYSKANDLDHGQSQSFFRAIIESNCQYMSAFSHTYKGTTNTHQVEAVHSALLVRDLLEGGDTPLVLLDGNEQKGIAFAKALRALGTNHDAIAHCLRAELYYPTSLLADVTASHMARRINSGAYSYENPLLRAPSADQTHNDWGKAYSGLYTRGYEYTPVDLPAQRGDTVRERIRCWYDGTIAFNDGVSRPETASIQPIANQLRNEGYERLATILSEL